MPPVKGIGNSIPPKFLQNLNGLGKNCVWFCVNVCIAVALSLDVALHGYRFCAIVHWLVDLNRFSIILEWLELALVIFWWINVFVQLAQLLTFVFDDYPSLTQAQRRLLGLKVSEPQALATSHMPKSGNKLGSCLDLEWLFAVRGRSPTSMLAYSPGVSPDISMNTSFGSVHSYPSPNTSQVSFSNMNNTTIDGTEREATFSEQLLRLGRARSCSPLIDNIRSRKQLLKFLNRETEFRGERLNYSLYSPSIINTQPSHMHLNLSNQSNNIGVSSVIDPQSPQTEKMDVLQTSRSFSTLYNSRIGSPSVTSPNRILSNSSTSGVKYNSWVSNENVLPSLSDSPWRNVGLDEDYLDVYAQNLRCWIATTILRPVVRQIELINQFLMSQSRADLLIGNATLATLEHSAQSNPALLKQLNPLMPYLNISTHQQYVVYRIKQLASDACIRDYKYDSGGPENVAGKGNTPWSDHLPSDGELIWHLLCVYMDNQIPPHPQHPRPFTGLYTCAPGAPVPTHPPPRIIVSPGSSCHAHLVDCGQVVNLPAGRNNLLHTILLWMAMAKEKMNGRIGQISMAESGFNLNHIFKK